LVAEFEASPIRVVHLITDLEVGGAEMTLVRLLEAVPPAKIEHTVVSLTSGGALRSRISAAGVNCIELGMRPGRFDLAASWRIVRELIRLRPHVLQTWLYHADLAGLIAGSLARVPAVVWNIRCAELDPRDHPKSLPMLLRLLAWTSRRPAAIVSNSVAGRRAHEELGYRSSSWEIIPNGFDTEMYKPWPAAREDFRNELRVPPNTLLAGVVARAHPMKDHRTFFQAAAVTARSRDDVDFVAVGRGIPENSEIKEQVRALGLAGRVHLLGERHDMPRVMAALDVAVSSSYSEAFPNVVAEAMACGTPPVVTDVGDSARIVGNAGHVVPRKDPVALGEAMVKIISMDGHDRQALGVAARNRIVDEYSLKAAADRYQQLYELLSHRIEAPLNTLCAG
jgi:glycosyltransferase involved in cell wall biosynthesis